MAEFGVLLITAGTETVGKLVGWAGLLPQRVQGGQDPLPRSLGILEHRDVLGLEAKLLDEHAPHQLDVVRWSLEGHALLVCADPNEQGTLLPCIRQGQPLDQLYDPGGVLALRPLPQIGVQGLGCFCLYSLFCVGQAQVEVGLGEGRVVAWGW